MFTVVSETDKSFDSGGRDFVISVSSISNTLTIIYLFVQTYIVNIAAGSPNLVSFRFRSIDKCFVSHAWWIPNVFIENPSEGWETKGRLRWRRFTLR